MRAARDADGNNIEVPENMTYVDWKKKFLDSSLQAPVIKDKIIRKAYDEFTSVLANTANENKAVLDMIMFSDTAVYQENPDLKVAFAYDMQKDVIMYNSKAPNFELYDLAFVQAHETSHRIDYKKYHSWRKCKISESD